MKDSDNAADIETAFIGTIRVAGLTPPRTVIADGKVHRFASNGKSHDDAGWYVLHPGKPDVNDPNAGYPAVGVFACWRAGIKQTWCSRERRTLSAEERRAFAKRVREARDKAKRAERERHKTAQQNANTDWARGKPADATHGYLARKGVGAYGIRELDGDILVPLSDTACTLHGVQRIDAAGNKKFPYGTAKTGHYHLIGEPGPRLIFAEGYATAASIHEATGDPVVVAFDAGNLRPVAEALHKKFPTAAIVIAGDNDKSGTGQRHAREAAAAVGGLMVLPDFGTDRPDGATDFNDLHQAQGPDALRRIIEAALNGPPGGELPDADVTAVTAVPSSNSAASGDTAGEADNVTDVTTDSVPAIPKEKDRPCFRVFDDWFELPSGEKFRPGVWFFGIKAGKMGDEGPTLTQQWICSPLHIEAVTSDGHDNNFGRLLRFKNTLGRWHEWAMPMESLRGSGEDLRGELLAMGVEIDPSANRLLGQYLQAIHPRRRIRCAMQVGWSGDSFVLPDAVIGPHAANVIFQSGERGHDEHASAGTLAGWRSEIAARAIGNPILTLALCASFAGPILARCHGESGGVHFVGDSSTGKTTAIEAACATWGGQKFRRSWRATANGIEGAAALHNDCLLALDEISECDPREIGAIVYALGNGVGKQRASRTGSARSVTRWRCIVLSSGERTIGTAMAEGGYRAKAGQSVRLLDVPAARRFGTWDNLHGFASGTMFADAIKRAATTHYGHAGRTFLEKLTRDPRDFCQLLERIKALPEFSTDGGEGQDRRASGRFALFALAGEVATEYGITGWPEGAAIQEAAVGFKAWLSLRGRGNDERRQILERVSAFIERHGDGRFSNADSNADVLIRDRAGWWRADGCDGRLYLFNSDGLREALKGFDFKRALDTLEEADALPKPDGTGERAKPQRIGGRPVRLYQINTDKLAIDHGP